MVGVRLPLTRIPNPRQIIMAWLDKLAIMNRLPKLTRLPGQTTMPRLTSMTDYDGRLARRTRLSRLYRLTIQPRLESWPRLGIATCSTRRTRLKGWLSRIGRIDLLVAMVGVRLPLTLSLTLDRLYRPDRINWIEWIGYLNLLDCLDRLR